MVVASLKFGILYYYFFVHSNFQTNKLGDKNFIVLMFHDVHVILLLCSMVCLLCYFVFLLDKIDEVFLYAINLISFFCVILY